MLSFLPHPQAALLPSQICYSHYLPSQSDTSPHCFQIQSHLRNHWRMEFSASTGLSNWSVAPKNCFPIFLLAIPFLAHSRPWKMTILNTYKTPFLLKWDSEYRVKSFVGVIIRYTALWAPSCQIRETYPLLDCRVIQDAPLLNSCI